MSDLLTQLRAYGEVLDDQSTAAVSGDGVGLELLTESDITFGTAAVGRRTMLKWSAAAMVAASAAAAGVLVRRAAVRSDARSAGLVPGPVIDASRSKPGVWMVLDDRSDALSVPFRAPAADGTFIGNQLRIAAMIPTRAGVVAVGSATVDAVDHATVWRSADGAEWQQTFLAADSDLWAVIETAAGQVVAAGRSWVGDRYRPSVWVSDDAVDWTRVDIEGEWGAFVFGGLVETSDRLILTGADAGNIPQAHMWSSFDGGRSWDPLEAQMPEEHSQLGAAAVSDRTIVMLAVHMYGRSTAIWRSVDDGQTWTKHELASPLSDAVASSVRVVDGGFIAWGVESSSASLSKRGSNAPWKIDGPSRLVAWTSPDGITWTRRAVMPEQIDPTTGQLAPIYQTWGGSITAGPDGLIGLAQAFDTDHFVNVELASPDGITWTVRELDLSGTPQAIITVDNGAIAIGARRSDFDTSPIDPDNESRNLSVWFRPRNG